MTTVPSVRLPSGDDLPAIGFGTWDLGGEDLETGLRAALEAGYAHVDTAEGYHNEELIGSVLSEYDREDVFLTSKVLPKHLDYESVIASCEASLDRLGTDYLDLYLIHWPNPAISLRETLDAMAALHDRGLIRNVGVSNFTAYQLSCALHVADVPIAVNQVECHPWSPREDLLAYCREEGVVVEAAAPLARTEVLGDETIRAIAEEYDRSPAQVVLRWAIERDVVALPKSSTPGHVRENLAVADWELDPEDRERIDAIDREQRVYDTGPREWADDVYGISR